MKKSEEWKNRRSLAFIFDETLNSLSNRIWSIHLFVSCFCDMYVNIFAFFVIIWGASWKNQHFNMNGQKKFRHMHIPKRLISIFEPLCEWFLFSIKNFCPLSLDDFQNIMSHFYFKDSIIFHAYYCVNFNHLEGCHLMTYLECAKMLKNQIYFILFFLLEFSTLNAFKVYGIKW